MKTGVIRRIDDLGRIVIPKEIRHSLAIKEGDPLEISLENNKICLERYRTGNIEVLNAIIENIRYDEYLGVDKGKVLGLLTEAKKLMSE